MIQVRETREEEAEVLSEIQKQAFAPLYERYHDESNPYLRGVEDVANRLDSPYFRYFTIFKEDEIVGGVLYKVKGKGLTYGELKPGDYYLQRVYIRSEYQCQGIAQTAILLCEKEFPDAVYYAVDFPQDLDKNRRCYEKAGFRDTGRRVETDPGVVLACFEKWVKA